jgi:protein SCO1/2
VKASTGNGSTGKPASAGLLKGVTLAVALAIVLLLVGGLASRVASNRRAAAQPTPTVVAAGTDLHDDPAPPFTLTDQHGATISLQSLRGHPVVLAFMDATCTEQCPIMVQYLNWTTQYLGSRKTAQVAWVAISVNPNNTPAQATAFLAKNQAAMNIHFLLGTQAQLAPLWKAYYIGVEPGQTDVAHTSGLYVIDQQGREREWVDAGFDPKALSADLQTVLGK